MKSRVAILLLLPWIACVDRVDFDPSSASLPLIIDGLYSTDTAKVRLSRGYPANGGYYYTRTPGATVWITDLDSPSWILHLFEEQYSGVGAFERYQLFNGTVYVASTISIPQIGHRYVLHVRLRNEEYASDPQLVTHPGTVDSIFYAYTSFLNRVKNVQEDGFIISFASTVPPGAGRYFQWRLKGTFSVAANFARGPDRCWATEREDIPILSDFEHGNRYDGVFAKYVPITFDRFNDRYRIEIRQYEVTREVWEFTEAIRFQLTNANSIFQPPFYTPKGNINATSGANSVIGVFTASRDTGKVIYIRRVDVPRPLYGGPLQADCRVVYPGSVVVQPPYWM